jgi:hypothetical protein
LSKIFLFLPFGLCPLFGHPDPLEVVPRGRVEELLAHVIVEAFTHLEALLNQVKTDKCFEIVQDKTTIYFSTLMEKNTLNFFTKY